MTADAYRTSLEELGLEDVRPLYRALLKRLKTEDPDAYADAVRRFEDEVKPAVEEGDDPLGEWLAYGRWLAGRLAPGRDVAVDPSGRSEELGDGTPPEGSLLLHLPESTRRRAVELALPAEPTDHQEAARELLCGS